MVLLSTSITFIELLCLAGDHLLLKFEVTALVL